jgi:hypothetical protein
MTPLAVARVLLADAEANLDARQAQVRDAYRRMTELRERVDGLEAVEKGDVG